MKTKLIQTKDYLLLVDEKSKINLIDLVYDWFNNQIRKYEDIGTGRKIVAYYPLILEAKELDLPLLPPFEMDVVDLAEVNSEKHHYAFGHQSTMYQLGFIEGHKAAQSKQFSLEDMKKAIELTRSLFLEDSLKASMLRIDKLDKIQQYIISSLSTQQLPKEFVPEYESDFNSCYCTRDICNGNNCPKIIKTITNSEGKLEVVGTYKY